MGLCGIRVCSSTAFMGLGGQGPFAWWVCCSHFQMGPSVLWRESCLQDLGVVVRGRCLVDLGGVVRG